MFTLGLNFDIIFILIMVAMIVIGYITGATVEVIKLVRIYIPFIVVFYLGGPISRIVYKSSLFKDAINSLSFLEGIPYFNTLIMFLSTFIAFFGSYFIIGIVVKFIQKRIQSEKVTYKLGKLNNRLGGLIAIIRFYVLFSLILIPFFILGFTSAGDFSTKLILDYPPPYTQVGRLVKSSQPVLKASNSVSNFLSVVDIDQLQKYYTVLTGLPSVLNGYEQDVSTSCTYTLDNDKKYPNLYAYVTDTNNTCTNPDLQNIMPYKGLIIWVSVNNLEIENMATPDLITSFNANYDNIQSNTTDENMKNNLESANKSTRIYEVVNTWLISTIGNYKMADLLTDEHIESIIDQLTFDKANESDNTGLFYELNNLNNPDLDTKLISVKNFIDEYPNYKKIMDTMPQNMSFKYRLIASTLQDFNFLPSINRTPLMAMYVIDSFKLLENSQLIEGEPLYDTLVKIAVPVYVLKKDENGNIKTFTQSDMKAFLTDHCNNKVCSIDDAFHQVIITDDFFLDLMNALVDESNGESSYINYLVDNSLMDKDAVAYLETYFANRYHDSEDPRVLTVTEALNKVGDTNG